MSHSGSALHRGKASRSLCEPDAHAESYVHGIVSRSESRCGHSATRCLASTGTRTVGSSRLLHAPPRQQHCRRQTGMVRLRQCALRLAMMSQLTHCHQHRLMPEFFSDDSFVGRYVNTMSAVVARHTCSLSSRSCKRRQTTFDKTLDESRMSSRRSARRAD